MSATIGWLLVMGASAAATAFTFIKCVQHAWAAGYYTGRIDQIEGKPVDSRAKVKLSNVAMP